MAAVFYATEANEEPSWDIQRDAFAPPSTRRLIRGWDRTPVPARASRLHGQTVWKKVVVKAAHIENDGNEAQDELLKEGAGARKKSRMMDPRENIGDAIWIDSLPQTTGSNIETITDLNGDQVEIHDGTALTGDEKTRINNPVLPSDTVSMKPSTHPDIETVPRKRTNTDRIITPRKPLRQTTLNQQAQQQPVGELPGEGGIKILRPRKSLRNSILGAVGENAADRRKSRTQSRLSIIPMQPAQMGNTAATAVEQDVTAEEDKTSRRRSRRNTATKRRSTLLVEKPIASNHDKSTAEATSMEEPMLPAAPILNPIIPQVPTAPILPVEVCTARVMKDIDTIGIETSNEGAQAHSESETSIENLTDIIRSNLDSQMLEAAPVSPTQTHNSPPKAHGRTEEASIEENLTEPSTYVHAEDVKMAQVPATQLSLYPKAAEPFKNIDREDEQQDANGQDVSSLLGNLGDVTPGDVDTANATTLENEESGIVAYEGLNAGPGSTSQVADPNKLEVAQASDPSTLALTEVTATSVHLSTYDHDDTDMLRNFLTRVKANKAAKNPPKRKRSLPHSPLRIPLGDLENNISPSPQRPLGPTDRTEASPSRRKKRGSPLADGEVPEPRSCRRSGRTRLPPKDTPGAPSFIPVRRLGQELETTITLKHNEEKELAALTRVNTRKNKGAALTALEVLAKKSEEREDPAMRQRLLKEVFDERAEKSRTTKEAKGQDKKSVTWAEELAQFRTLSSGPVTEEKAEKEAEKATPVAHVEEKKPGAVRVGVRSKAALGMVLNGTPAPKRRMRGRS